MLLPLPSRACARTCADRPNLPPNSPFFFSFPASRFALPGIPIQLAAPARRSSFSGSPPRRLFSCFVVHCCPLLSLVTPPCPFSGARAFPCLPHALQRTNTDCSYFSRHSSDRCPPHLVHTVISPRSPHWKEGHGQHTGSRLFWRHPRTSPEPAADVFRKTTTARSRLRHRRPRAGALALRALAPRARRGTQARFEVGTEELIWSTKSGSRRRSWTGTCPPGPA